MAESNAGNKFWMVVAIVAIIGLIVAVATRPSVPESAPDPTPNPAAEVAKKPAPPALPALPDGPPEAPDPDPVDTDFTPAPGAVSAVDAPGAPSPTLTGPSPNRGPEGSKYPLRGLASVPDLLKSAVDEIGEDKLKKYLKATYEGFTTEAGAPVPTVVSVSAGKGAHISYPASANAYQIAGSQCIQDLDGAIGDCRPLEAARAWAYRAAHDSSLLLPLSKPPYKLLKAVEFRPADDVGARDAKAYTYAIAGTQLQVEVLQDPDTLRPLGVAVTGPELLKQSINKLNVALSGWDDADGTSMPLRWKVSYLTSEEPPIVVKQWLKGYTVHFTKVAPGAAAAEKPLPAAQKANGAIRYAPRRGLMVVAGAVAADTGFWQDSSVLVERLPYGSITLPHEVALAVAQDGTQQALLVPQSPNVAMAATGASTLAAQPNVARQLVKATPQQLAAQLTRFAADLTAKGHQLAPGPRLALAFRYPILPDSAPLEKGTPALFELQVPVAAKAAP